MPNLAAAQMSEKAPSFLERISIRSVALFVFFGALWFGLFRQLSGEWSLNDQYSYGWFVPFFAALLFWLRWEDATSAPVVSGQWSVVRRKRGLAISIGIIALLFLLFPIRLFEIANPDWRPLSWLHAAVVAGLTLIYIWYAGGLPWLRHFAFPVLFIFVAVPWITPVEVPVVQGLMRLVAEIASDLATLFGIPAQLQGNVIRVSNGLVGVNEACSGVRSLQTSLMIGLLFGELKRLSILRRVALVFAAAVIAFVGNCARAFFLVWIAATRSIAEVSRWHDLAGYGIVAAVFVGTLALAILLSRKRSQLSVSSYQETENKQQISNNSRHSPFVIRHSSFLAAAALVWLIIIEIAAAGWYRAHESYLVAARRWEVQWPRDEPNFHEIKIDDDVRRTLRFDEGRAASWTWRASNSKPLNCVLYFFRWNPGSNSALLANLHRPDVCLPAIGWTQVADTGVKEYPAGESFALPVRRFEFLHRTGDESTQQVAHAFYCLWEDRVAAQGPPQMSTSPSSWTRSERIDAVLEGRRHLGQQVMELIVQGRGSVDEAQVQTEFAKLIPQLVKVEGR